MSQVKMGAEEKRELLLKVFDLFSSGHEEEAAELARREVPVEKFVERAWGREYLEANGYNTAELD